MKVQIVANSYYLNTKLKTSTEPTFKASLPVETIKHYNLGMMSNGYVGKVKVLRANNEEVLLNVFKQAQYFKEIYRLQDDFGKVIGKIELKIKKFEQSDNCVSNDVSNHIYVEELKNYSRPDTPYYMKGLEEYKQIGVRLLQIAQRRSDECGLEGNIELIAKNEAIPFYEKIGFKRIIPKFSYMNPNKMYLPAEAKEPFSKLYSGL